MRCSIVLGTFINAIKVIPAAPSYVSHTLTQAPPITLTYLVQWFGIGAQLQEHVVEMAVVLNCGCVMKRRASVIIRNCHGLRKAGRQVPNDV